MDAGASCKASIKADTEEELLQKVEEHLRTKHRVQHVTQTLQKYALEVARRG